MILVGGAATIYGPVLAGVLLTYVSELMAPLGPIRFMVLAVMIIVTMLFVPQGIWGFFANVVRASSWPLARRNEESPTAVAGEEGAYGCRRNGYGLRQSDVGRGDRTRDARSDGTLLGLAVPPEEITALAASVRDQLASIQSLEDLDLTDIMPALEFDPRWESAVATAADRSPIAAASDRYGGARSPRSS